MTRSSLGQLRRTPPLLLVQKVLRRIPFRPIDVGKLCFLRLDGVPQVPRSRLRGAGVVRQATRDDLDALVRLRDQRPLFLERFDKGDHCVVAEVDGRIVGFEWFSERSVHRDTAWGYEVAVPDGFVYAYDAYLDPAVRNTGVWLRFKAYLGDLMVKSGKRGVLTFVDYGNWTSFRTHVRFGFKPCATVLAFKVIGYIVSLNLDSI